MNAPQNTSQQESAFEARLRSIVSDGIDQRLAPPRTAPPFDPDLGNDEHGPSRRWVVALVAAACVLILAAGALVAGNVLRGSKTQPAEPAPTPSFTALGGAKIALPQGWTATPDNSFLGHPGWCLSPRPRPALAGEDTCPVWLWKVPRSEELSTDSIDGWPNNYHPQCELSASTSRDADVISDRQGRRVFGGRPAMWHGWTFSCGGTKRLGYEQYLVLDEPKWSLYSGHTDIATYRDAITSIARNSQLPG